MQGMMKAALIGRSRFPRARPGQWVAANAVPRLRSIRKVANGLAFTILLLIAAVAVALLAGCESSTQIEGANPTSSMPQMINDFATLLVKALADTKVV